jgi:pseudaminic acid biosynthesis-associated methylase
MSKAYRTEQERFWATTYAEEYIQRNREFDHELGASAWRLILEKAGRIDNYLEFGCNIGRNIEQLKRVLPEAEASVIEISEPAFEYVTSAYTLANAFNGSILDSRYESGSFDLVFSMGVLIHVPPDELLEHMQRMWDYSSSHILMGEYFNRTPVSIEYRGEPDRLFKRDFGRLFIDNFDVRLLDYGFLWGYIYDSAGFGDVTWWLFEKR